MIKYRAIVADVTYICPNMFIFVFSQQNTKPSNDKMKIFDPYVDKGSQIRFS